MSATAKQAKKAAFAGLIMSLISFITVFIFGAVSSCPTIAYICWQALAGMLIWFVLLILYHQRSLAEQEKLDMAQLAAAKDGDTIFQGNADRTALFAVAQKRLEMLEKWFVPISAVVIALYEIGIGAYLLSVTAKALSFEVKNELLSAVILAMIALFSFLFSRYTTGMSSDRKWKDLRAGGSMLLCTAILSFAVAIALAFANYKADIGLVVLRWVIPSLLILLGIETGLNSILDIYRPRIAGQYSRAAFDSRLLGLFNEPGGILHTVASTIDYQFGFKVSQTWFYKLLEKAIVPLVLLLIVSLYALSCVVIIDAGQEAVIEHLGSFKKVVGPGVTWKLPAPFDKAIVYSTQQIHQVNVGFVEEQTEEDAKKPLLWGEQHYKEEYNLLAATRAEGVTGEEGVVPVSLVRAAVPVQYKVKDLKDFIYNHENSEAMLKAIAYREVVKFAVSATVESDDEDIEGGKLSILGAGRAAAGKYLKEQIQQMADKEGLGVEIVFVGLQGVHPPPDVAADYQAVVGSVQLRQKLILEAEAEKNSILSSITGSVKEADELYALALQYQQAKEERDDQKSERLGKELKEAFAKAEGEVFKTLSEAESYAFERAETAKASGERFTDQIKAYEASPEIYKRQLRLAMLEEALANIRKYVVIPGEGDNQVYIIDLEEKLTTDLYDMDIQGLGK